MPKQAAPAATNLFAPSTITMPSSLDNAVDHLAAAEIANPYQPSKPAKPLPPHGPFLVALLVAIGGWSASLAWVASLASDLSAIAATITVLDTFLAPREMLWRLILRVVKC